MRPKQHELDPDLLDKHDSFYHTTKSLLVLFQIMGVMPIQRSPPGNLLFAYKIIQTNIFGMTVRFAQDRIKNALHSIGVPVYLCGPTSSMAY